MKKLLIIILVVIVVSNLPIFSFLRQENYTYNNADGSFMYSEEVEKVNLIGGCQRMYDYFLCQHPEKDQDDNQLYRTFIIKPWRFWEWFEMIFHSERFKLPYRNP